MLNTGKNLEQAMINGELNILKRIASTTSISNMGHVSIQKLLNLVTNVRKLGSFRHCSCCCCCCCCR